jgi:hypothetical protein
MYIKYDTAEADAQAKKQEEYHGGPFPNGFPGPAPYYIAHHAAKNYGRNGMAAGETVIAKYPVYRKQCGPLSLKKFFQAEHGRGTG